MGLATNATVLANCGLINLESTAIIDALLPDAVRTVVGRIGQTLYDAIEAAAGDPYTAAAKTAVTRAESLIAGAQLVRGYAHRVGNGGETAAIMSGDGTQTTMKSLDDMNRRARVWEADAFAILAPWEQKYRSTLEADDPALNTKVFRAGPLTFAALGAQVDG